MTVAPNAFQRLSDVITDLAINGGDNLRVLWRTVCFRARSLGAASSPAVATPNGVTTTATAADCRIRRAL